VPHSFLEQLRRWQASTASAATPPRTSQSTPASTAATSAEPAPSARPSTAPSSSVEVETVIRPVKPGTSSISRRELAYLGVGAGAAAIVLMLVFAFVAIGDAPPGPVLSKGAAAPEPTKVQAPTAPIEAPPPPSPSPSTRPQPRFKEEDVAQLFDEKKYAEAVNLAQTCLKEAPKDPDCLKLAGDAYAALGTKETAEEMYLGFLRVAPQDPRAAEVGLSLRRLSTGTVRPPPGKEAARQAKAAYEEALRLVQSKQHSRAIPLAQRCVELTPNNADCEMLLGACYAALSKPEEGSKHYRRFLELAPSHRMAPAVRQILQAYDKQKSTP
jgi:hypothetical protein